MVYMTSFTLMEKKHSCSISTVFVHGVFVYYCYGKALTIFTKCSIFDVAGVLNPCQYELTWIAYRNNYIQVLMNRSNWST